MILCHCRVGMVFKLIKIVKSTTVFIRQMKRIILVLLFANSRISCCRSTGLEDVVWSSLICNQVWKILASAVALHSHASAHSYRSIFSASACRFDQITSGVCSFPKSVYFKNE